MWSPNQEDVPVLVRNNDVVESTEENAWFTATLVSSGLQTLFCQPKLLFKYCESEAF